MELNSKKLERTSKIVYWSIAVVLCGFLILLAQKIIGDLDNAVSVPDLPTFRNEKKLAVLQKQYNESAYQIDNLASQKETIERTRATAEANYKNEKESFENWLQTRKTLGSPDKDQEVVSRAKRLDNYYKIEQEWRLKLDSVNIKTEAAEAQSSSVQRLIDNEEADAQNKLDDAMKRYDLKVFLTRLLFVSPILALGIFFFIRYRNHKFWPIFLGFTLFSLYAFFFGLLPYLPSYGGYVRYTVGILLSVGLGYYAIKQIREFIDRKEAELKTSTQERAKKVQTDTAEKALENHFCPSCGKDFILKKWETPLKTNETDSYKLVTNFCRHCGLELFSTCTSCGNKNFAHLPFCASCGAKNGKEKVG